MKQDIVALRAEHEKDIAALRAERANDQLKLLLPNFMIDVVRFAAMKLNKTDIVEKHSSQSLQRFAQSLTADQLVLCEIPSKYKEIINGLSQVI